MPVVIVTGASSGIGRVTAERLARNGATVVLAARRADTITALAEQLPNAVAVPTDVRDQEALTRLVEQAVAVTGRIDGLVNNAGVGGVASVLSEDADIEGMIQVNLLAPIRLMRAVVPIMRAQGSGSIVNIGSVAGEVGISGVYSATKFGLRGMTDSVRRELAGTGIGVTLIEPGYIAGPANRNRSGLPGPEIVAAAVESALRRPRRRMIVPAKYRAAVMVANVFPGIADRMYAGKAAGKSDVKGRL